MNSVSRVIVHPTKKQQKNDIALVIPCYDEWIWVLDTLYSAAIESERTDCKVAVFLVVNNSQNCDPEVLEQNILTAKLVVDIIWWKVLWHKKESGYYYKERKKIERIRKSWFTLWLVDCYSKRNAPEICNVWYARDVWTRSILPFLQNKKCVIAHTDGDCKLWREYFSTLEEYYFPHRCMIPTLCWEIDEDLEEFWNSWCSFFELTSPYISVWNTSFYFDTWYSQQWEQFHWIGRFESLMKVVWERIIPNFWTPKNSTNLTAWAHHHYRKSVFDEIWWYKHIAWWEDVIFWTMAQKLWYTVERIPTKITTLCRPSERTEKWHGMWFEVLRKAFWKLCDVPINSVEYYEQSTEAYDILQSAHESDDFVAFIQNSRLSEIISSDVVTEILQLYETYWWGEEMKKYHILWAIHPLETFVRNILKEKYPQAPLHEVILEVMDIVDNDKDVNRFMDLLDIPKINHIHIKNPGIENDTLFGAYVAIAYRKLQIYNLIVNMYNYFWIFLLFSDSLSEIEWKWKLEIEWYSSLQSLKTEVISIISNYLRKVVLNLIVEYSSWYIVDEVIKVIDILYDDFIGNKKISHQIEKIDIALEFLNNKYGTSFSSLLQFLDVNELVKRYKAEDSD